MIWELFFDVWYYLVLIILDSYTSINYTISEDIFKNVCLQNFSNNIIS